MQNGGTMKTIDFGMPTLIESSSLESCVKLCKQLGLDFIELNMNLPQYQIESIDIEQLKSICKSESIYFTIHLDENLNVCDFNNKIAHAYMKTVLSTIEIAKQLKYLYLICICQKEFILLCQMKSVFV